MLQNKTPPNLAFQNSTLLLSHTLWVRSPGWVLYFRGSHETAVKVSARVAVSSEGFTGEGSASKLIRLLAGVSFSQVVGLKTFVPYHMDLSSTAGSLLCHSMQDSRASSKKEVTAFCHLITEMMSCHLCGILFIVKSWVQPTRREGISHGMHPRRWRPLGPFLDVHYLTYLSLCISFVQWLLM